MLLKLVLLVTLAALAGARRAPNADYAAQVLRESSPGRMSSEIEEDVTLDVPGLIKKYGYPVEIHHVTTSDGYILEMHRIPHGRDNNNQADSNKPVVFVMHGLLSSSADFIVLGPGNALAYLLAEAGYDVWLGNARGNYYSRHHVTKDPDSTSNHDFWKFSWDEIGHYDLPAMIDYALETTGQKKLHYIGHSQGGTTFLVLNSLRPEYNEKFISFQGLAPASFFNNNPNALFNSLAQYEDVIENTAFALGHAEIFANRDFINWFKNTYCVADTPTVLEQFCAYAMTNISAREYYNTTMVPVFLAHAPAGASIRQAAHYGQCLRYKAFRRYNYNIITNLLTYGKTSPPEYNLSKVTVPAYLHYGFSDQEVNYKDLILLSSKLPNVQKAFKVPRESFNHFDFIWGIDVKELVYDVVMASMKEAESKL